MTPPRGMVPYYQISITSIVIVTTLEPWEASPTSFPWTILVTGITTDPPRTNVNSNVATCSSYVILPSPEAAGLRESITGMLAM
ncbi:hypothetical protein GQ53DRAFT_752959 [Thozetella sp. PMI_491]|nr:hypothetical protein GQ53DRAFT_752959 [Thozetella sp. PMI_491]